MSTQKLSELQLELLKVYSFEPSEAELLEIKRMLANFFSKRLVNKVQEGIEKKEISNDDLEGWLNEKA